MADINLLPEELREKEKKELEAMGKKPKDFNIKMTQPSSEPPVKETKPKVKSSFWGGFLAKKPLKNPPNGPLLQSEKITEKVNPDLEPVRFRLKTPLPDQKPATQPNQVKPVPLPPPPTEIPFKKTEKELPQELTEIKKTGESRRPKFSLFGGFKRKSAGAQKEKLLQSSRSTSFLADKKPARKSDKKPAKLDVNLIPEEFIGKEEKNISRRLLNSGLIIILALAVVGMAYLGLVWYKLKVNQQISELETQVQQLEGQIASRQATRDAAINLQERLKLIKGLLSQHVYWTNFFNLLEKYTIDEVYYTNFSMTGTQKVILTAIGRDYESVARQLVSFQTATDFIAEAEVNSALAKLDDNGNYLQVSFTINLTLKPDVFIKSVK